MGASDVFLFPSHYEAFSLATIEAAACGLPVLAPRINGTEELIESGVTGEFLTYDPDTIAGCLQNFLRCPEAARTMGEEARRVVERNFTWDRVATMTAEAYRELIELRNKFRPS